MNPMENGTIGGTGPLILLTAFSDGFLFLFPISSTIERQMHISIESIKICGLDIYFERLNALYECIYYSLPSGSMEIKS